MAGGACEAGEDEKGKSDVRSARQWLGRVSPRSSAPQGDSQGNSIVSGCETVGHTRDKCMRKFRARCATRGDVPAVPVRCCVRCGRGARCEMRRGRARAQKRAVRACVRGSSSWGQREVRDVKWGGAPVI